jgi:hypothetical protein
LLLPFWTLRSCKINGKAGELFRWNSASNEAFSPDIKFERTRGMPAPHDDHVEKNKTEARQGVTLHSMRYVLGISLALVIVAFVLAYVFAV